ncbi:MAG TPA: DUF5700 domain-containing putative Zn-dependent protease [Thermoanaerobaculia bacterium]
MARRVRRRLRRVRSERGAARASVRQRGAGRARRLGRGIADYPGQLAQLQQFFEDIAEGKLKGDDVDKRGFQFFGLVGPWYTVGWRMAGVIEEELGRQALIDAFCDSATLMATYNRAADAHAKRTGERLPHFES